MADLFFGTQMCFLSIILLISRHNADFQHESDVIVNDFLELAHPEGFNVSCPCLILSNGQVSRCRRLQRVSPCTRCSPRPTMLGKRWARKRVATVFPLSSTEAKYFRASNKIQEYPKNFPPIVASHCFFYLVIHQTCMENLISSHRNGLKYARRHYRDVQQDVASAVLRLRQRAIGTPSLPTILPVSCYYGYPA